MTSTNITVPRLRQFHGLVGRDVEIKSLHDAYARVRDAPNTSCEAILVHGESGTGKTALVNESFLRQHEDGTMVSGKFDIIHSTRPYSAIVDALTQLCQTKTWSNISDEEELLANIRKRLGTGDLKILSQLVPAVKRRLKWLLDESDAITSYDPASSVDGTFAFARFSEVVRLFLYLVARSLPSPLVLFLDDVQAADQESLSIISSLTTMHSEARNLLLILSYRDQTQEKQLNRRDVLSDTSMFRVTDITVGNLDEDHGNKLISKLLADPEDSFPLSLLITQRTAGNVYFSLQFLDMLKEENLLGYSFERCQWTWNLDKIRADTNVTDNVAHLLTSKIQQLTPDVQLALQLAACLGFYFDVTFLESIAMQEKASISCTNQELQPDISESDDFSAKRQLGSSPFSRALAKAVEEHLIDPAGGTKYKFTHDRVLQASYDMIPVGRERDKQHWRIGEVLWRELCKQQCQNDMTQNLSEASDYWLLFTAADQLNRGSDCNLFTTDGVTPLVLAKLNMDAGKAASDKSAFKHAAGFFDRGVKLIERSWQSEYSLCLELHTRSAETEYAASNLDTCDKRINEILGNGRCLEDKLPAYFIKIQCLGVRGRVLEAIEESMCVLRGLDERVPRRPNLLQMLHELSKTKRLLKGRKIADLALLPEMTSPRKIWAIKFLQKVVIFAWYARQKEPLFISSCRMMQLTVNYGISNEGAYVLALYGGSLGYLGDMETANELGKAALEVIKRSNSLSSYAGTIASVAGFLQHLKQPITRSLDLLMDGYNTGIKEGDIDGAAVCLSSYSSMGIFLGKQLDVVIGEMEGFRQAYRNEFESSFTLICVTVWHQLVLNLMGRSENPLKLNGDVLREESFLSVVDRTGNKIAKTTFNIARMVLLHILGDFEAASKEVAKIELQILKGGTYYTIPFLLMFAGLTMLSMVRKTRKRRYWRRANLFQRAIKKFVDAGNLNVPPMLELMLAEQASLRRGSQPEDVKKAYESAVRVAAQSGFTVVQAIGYERAGEYMLSLGDNFWAKTFLLRALLLYDEWGATAKTKKMTEDVGTKRHT